MRPEGIVLNLADHGFDIRRFRRLQVIDQPGSPEVSIGGDREAKHDRQCGKSESSPGAVVAGCGSNQLTLSQVPVALSRQAANADPFEQRGKLLAVARG